MESHFKHDVLEKMAQALRQRGNSKSLTPQVEGLSNSEMQLLSFRELLQER
jgi:hypothetical protein